MGNTIVKANAKKVRRIGKGDVIAGFAGATADAFALFERLEAKLEMHPGNLARACVELAKDWRTDRYLRRLEAMMAVADKTSSLILSGTGDVLEPEDSLIGIGSGGAFARGDRPQGHDNCRRNLRFHQRKHHDGNAGDPLAPSSFSDQKAHDLFFHAPRDCFRA